MSWRHLDESDVRIRPNRRGSRPRTKERPAHADARPGSVIAVDRGRYTVLLGDPTAPNDAPTEDRTVVLAMRAREVGRRGIVLGDRVDLVGDTSGDPDALARIVRVRTRRTTLRRSADDADPVERVIVANADQLVIVTALAQPDPRPRFVDRCLVAAYDGGLTPLLVLTKSDLRPADGFLGEYAPLDVPALVTGRDRPDSGLSELRDRLAGRISVLVGPSGVGKSTLVNAIVPRAEQVTGAVNEVTGRGRHTTTAAVAHRLPEPGGWIVDTPGLRSFGLAHVTSDQIIDHFPDLEPGAATCPRGCSHVEAECGLDDYVAAGQAGPAGPARLESLRRLLQARAGRDVDDHAP